MDEDGIPEVLKTERMGHELPGMHGVYGHVSAAMQAELKAALQGRWEQSLRERARLSPRSVVPALGSLLAAHRRDSGRIRRAFLGDVDSATLDATVRPAHLEGVFGSKRSPKEPPT